MMNNKAFTLTEILLVAVMITVLGVAIFKTFSNGVRLWARSEHILIEGDMAMFFDRMAEDLRNWQDVDGIKVKGLGTRFAFPTIVRTAADTRSSRAGEKWIDQLGMVEYYFEPSEKRIYRRQANYGQALKGRWQEAVMVLSLVDELILQYDEVAKTADKRMGQGISDSRPRGVLVEIAYTDGKLTRRLKRFLPVLIGEGL